MSDHECCVGLELSAIGGDVPPEHRRFVVEAYDDQGVSRAASVAFATVVDELLAKGYGLDRCEDAVIVRMAEPHRVRLRPIGEPPAPLPRAQWRCEAYASAPEELKVAAWAATPFAALSAAYSALVRHRGRYRGGLDGVVSEIRTLALELERLGRDADGEGARLLGCASDRLHGALDDLAGVIEMRLLLHKTLTRGNGANRIRYKCSFQGNVVEVSCISSVNDECPIVKLDADSFVVKSEGTGEVHEFQHGESRMSNLASVRRTFRNLRALINANATEPRNLRWVTLTFADAVTELPEVYQHFRKFVQRARRWFGHFEYIAVVEPRGEFEGREWHGRHVHCLWVFEHAAPFIPVAELRECWGLGIVDIRAVKDVQNISNYLAAYVGNVEVGDGEDFDLEAVVDGERKRYVKGARLHLYPPGAQIYRHSRGVRKPEERWITPEEYREITGGMERTHRCEYEYSDPVTGFTNFVIKETYRWLALSRALRRSWLTRPIWRGWVSRRAIHRR